MMNRAGFEFFSGLDGQGIPTWSRDIGQRRSVFHDSNSVGSGTRVMYHPTLERYLLTTWHDESGGWGIFDAPEPWGPWTMVAYYSPYDSFNAIRGTLTLRGASDTAAQAPPGLLRSAPPG